MKRRTNITPSTVLVCLAILASNGLAAESPRNRETLDFDWRFQLGDPQGAETNTFDERGWRKLDVPHDWSIEGEYRQDHPAGIGGGYLPTGIGWYRKHLPWKTDWKGKRILLAFDGVYMNSDVWVNGKHVGKRPYGYISFEYDITDHLQAGDNVIAVRVDHSLAPSGRWYTGSGIYRHVWLTTVDPIHIPNWGTFVRAKQVSQEKATLEVSTEIKNLSDQQEEVELETSLRDAKGKTVSSTRTKVTLRAGEQLASQQSLEVIQPQLWSPGEPSLYRVVSTVRVGDQVRDIDETSIGIREIQFTVDRGFLINGKPLEIQGMCMHHDAGPVGAAVPNDVLRRRLMLLKKMGVNTVRTSHNPFAPEFYEIADEIGLMVMDEAFDGWAKEKAKYDYGLYFEDWWQRDLTDFIRRDRNHPSVIIWSIGNEVHDWLPSDQKRLVDFIRALDPTRPVTQGRGHSGMQTDIVGYNGQGEMRGEIKAFHKKHPSLPIIGTEITHTLQTRGVYRTQTWYRTRDNPAPWEREPPGPAKKWEMLKDSVHMVPDLAVEEVFTGVTPKYQSSYDNSFVRMSAREEIRLAKELPYLLGTFRWTAFDYLGESFDWPARTANFGILDLAGFPKDHYYLYQSHWSKEPMIHLLPHWTHPGKEGVTIPVVVYTNQPSAELFLNGRSLGKQSTADAMQLVWQVPYQPGTLEAVATNQGAETARKKVRTAGKAAAVEAKVDRKAVQANRTDVIHVEVDIVDARGELVPEADALVDFEIRGPAKLIGVENGDILDLAPHKVRTRKAFRGKCLAIVQTLGTAGEIAIVASSPGLLSAEITVKSIP